MGDLTKLAKARRELEELYLGVPDESVNLTFQDLAEVTKNVVPASEKRKAISMEPVPEGNSKREGPSPLNKAPSLDFSRGLQACRSSYSPYHHHHDDGNKDKNDSHAAHRHHHHHLGGGGGDGKSFSGHASPNGSGRHSGYIHELIESSMAYDDTSHVSMASTISPFSQRGKRRRPGIPHSNICAICNTYIYIFRHRCLVCGRVYCRSCLSMGMGEMTEGRKCIACLGRRFSQRYIKSAGDIGCCARYPSMAKQQELLWAEKGPRRSNERGQAQNRSMMMSSRSRSPVTPRTPTRSHHHHQTSNTPSFVMNSPYSPYSPTHHHPIPF